MAQNNHWLHRLWPLFAYLALTLVWTWPLASHLNVSLGGGLDPLLQTWVLAWDAHALTMNPAMVWQAPIFFPYPDTLAYSDHHLLLAMMALPILALGKPILAYNLLVALSYALTGWAVYLLVLELIAEHAPSATDRIAAFAAGALFGFGTYRMAHVVHLQLLQTAWLPLALLFLHRYLRRRDQGGGCWRDALLFGAFGGIQGVTALYYAYFMALAIGLYGALWFVTAVWRAFHAREVLPWRQIGGLMLGGGVALIIVAPLTLPYLRVYQYLGIVRSSQELANWSAPLQAYLATPVGNWLYGATDGPFAASGGEFALFPGFVTLALALTGVFFVFRHAGTQHAGTQHAGTQHAGTQHAASLQRDGLFLILLALAAFVLSLGTGIRLTRADPPIAIPLPYALFYERLPGFGALRVPARWAMLVHLALTLLAGIGSARLLKNAGPAARRGLWQVGIALLLGAALLEHLVIPVPLAVPPAAPPVYAWLGAAEQRDIQAVLELPVGATPRGAELDRITMRQFYQIQHWRPLATGYSGLIPFGTSDMLRRVQRLPDDETLRYLAILGVDTIVIHRDEYEPAKLAELLAWADATPLLERRAEVGDALVYTIGSDAALAMEIPAGASIFVSNDERVPGMPAMALVRRWQAAGAHLYGAQRTRYYPALATPDAGQVFQYGLLAAAEDPAPAGFDSSGLQWVSNGLAFYAGDPALRLALDLGRPVAGQFHPAYPASLNVKIGLDGARLDDRLMTWQGELTRAYVEVEVASLIAQRITIGATAIDILPGVTTVGAIVPLDTDMSLVGQDNATALRRLRVWAEPRAPAPPADGALAVAAECRFDGSQLLVTARAGGAGALLIDVRGAAARDDQPIHLLAGIQPIASSGGSDLQFSVDLLHPAEPWLTDIGEAEDGRYIVYLKSGANPDAPGAPIAKFSIRNGAIADPEPVPLPLTIVR